MWHENRGNEATKVEVSRMRLEPQEEDVSVHRQSHCVRLGVRKNDQSSDSGSGGRRGQVGKTHVTEEDFETTEGESQDLYEKLMEIQRWWGGRSQTSKKRMTGTDSCLILFVFYESRFVFLTFKSWRPHNV